MDCVSLFLDALQSTFGPLNLIPIADGSIHRFHIPEDRTASLNGWYVLHTDGIASGAFGSWKTGYSRTWSARKPNSRMEMRLITQRMEHSRRHREDEQRQRNQTAAEHAQRLWRRADSANPAHPYLVAKHTWPLALRQSGDELFVPLTKDGRLVNIQRIFPDGAKRFLSGGIVKGAYSPIGRVPTVGGLYLCEGWATGATLHASTGAAVACAMTAGNLLEVGLSLRRQYPANSLIIAGDDDRRTSGNPGRTFASKAAAVLGCDLVFPEWPKLAPRSLSDFNDLHVWWRRGR